MPPLESEGLQEYLALRHLGLEPLTLHQMVEIQGPGPVSALLEAPSRAVLGVVVVPEAAVVRVRLPEEPVVLLWLQQIKTGERFSTF
jgi:hypothetical protein